MIVDPKEKLPGSTSVACWLVAFVKASVLNFTSGVVAGGKFEPKLLDPLFAGGLDPQLKPARTANAQKALLKTNFNTSPLLWPCLAVLTS
jgi:hypothetical protein